jgi:hypothetical protein
MKLDKCFYCNKDILKTDEKRNVPLDRPYVNLPFHEVCLDSIEDVTLFLTQNLQRVYTYIENRKLSTQKG